MPCPTWFVCSPGQVIASPRGVETSLIEVTSSPHKPRCDAGERSLLFSQASLLSFWTFSFSVTKIFGPLWFFHSQVGIVSSPSFTTSGFSSHFSSLVPPPWAEEYRPSCSSGDQSEPPSLSSGVMTRADVKALQALEVMKSSHDFDSTVNILGKDVQRLKESGDLDMVATVKKQASEAQSLLDHLRTESEEVIRQHESLEKELSEIWESLSVSQGQLSEARGQLSDS
ncbi:hypothetical protein B296_00050693 [Ensete ventricosum]|uniref:Uncharacterized protein n=1 Tax=Ensete ventricosum TaxID=4639 RepID=A0A426XCW2_ENSVE|nr:hypothetical protein B296_00050693 [Ensete ventricosum]